MSRKYHFGGADWGTERRMRIRNLALEIFIENSASYTADTGEEMDPDDSFKSFLWDCTPEPEAIEDYVPDEEYEVPVYATDTPWIPWYVKESPDMRPTPQHGENTASPASDSDLELAHRWLHKVEYDDRHEDLRREAWNYAGAAQTDSNYVVADENGVIEHAASFGLAKERAMVLAGERAGNPGDWIEARDFADRTAVRVQYTEASNWEGDK